MSLNQWIDDFGHELELAAGRRSRRTLGVRPAALSLAVACALAAAAVGLVAVLPTEPELPATPPPPAVRTVPPGEVLGEPAPYMGVSCERPNRFECDRIGLSVRLREPARAVAAEVGGRSFPLDDEEWTGHSADRYRSAFAGFLQPAGLTEPGGPLSLEPDAPDGRWLGKRRVSAPVTLTITLASGERVRTEVEVRLHAGWG